MNATEVGPMVDGYCDRCGATAKAVARVNGTDLRFCDHHYHTHRIALLEKYTVSISEDSMHFEAVSV